MMKYISKSHLILLMILVAILGIMLLLGEHYSRVPQPFSGEVPASTVATEGEKLLYNANQPQNQIASKSFIIRSGQSKLSYDQALDLYKNDLLQFNEDCQVSSGNKNFHLNNEIMIDNRSSKANTFMVGDSLVAIPPYDFAFMILREAGPRIGVHCGSQRNVTTISVL